MNYIKFNEYGQRSGMEITNIVKLSDNADRIYIFYDLDTSTEESAYRCFARIKRADGFKIADTILTLTIYAFDTEAEAEEYGTATYNEITLKWDVPCRELTMTEEMLGADGDLQITIVYQEVDELGSVIATKVNSMSVIPVYDSVAPEYDDASTLEILETFMLRDLSDITDGVHPTVADKILVRQGGATKLITVGQLNDLLETGITIFKKIAMDTASPAPSLSIGETRWNAEVETLETRVGNDVYLQHGQELVFKCKNTSGVDISNGTPVYITGASGSSPNFYIARASSSDYVQTSRCIGLTTEDIDDGAWGKVCVIGIVNGLNTNTFEVGDVVYLGAGGIITNVRPTTNVLALGVVIQKSLTDGRIALRPIFFPRPEDLSTVHYSGLANGNILVKDATGWTNYALANKANVADLTAGTITVRKAEQDKDGNAIGITYVKVSGVNAMTGNLNLGTHKITNLADGVADQDGATMKNIDTKITAHDGSETAHLYIRELIEALEQEIERLDGRGKSYGEIAYTTAQLLALSQEILDDTITDAVALGHGGTGYTPSNGDLVYDTGVGAGVSYHEWEFNGTNWVDNGLIGYSKASNTIYGMIKGDGTYLSVVSGLVEVLKSNYADKIGTSGGSYTYTQILNAFADRYTKAEVDAIIDALKTAFGWEETDLGDYSTAIDLSSYDLVVLKYESEQGANDISITEIFSPSAYAQTDVISLVIHSAEDDSVLGAGSFLKGATTWSYVNSVGTNTLSMRGYKIKPIQAENVEVAFTGTTYLNSADDVKEALTTLDTEVEKKENKANKVTAFQATPDDTHYASEKLVKDSLDAKVDKVDGKGLSTNDFTNEKSAQIETNKTDIATNLANQALIDSRQDLRLATVEENLRKSMANEIQGTASGTDIISLGKDVAPAPLKVEVDGGLIPALENLIPNGQFNNANEDWIIVEDVVIYDGYLFINSTTDGTKMYISNLTSNNVYYLKSFINKTTTGYLRIYVGGSDVTVFDTNEIYYNPNFSTGFNSSNTNGNFAIYTANEVAATFDNMQLFNLTVSHGVTETSGTAYDNAVADIEAMLALNDGYISSTPIHAVGMNKRVRSVGKNLFDKSKYATSYAYKIPIKSSTAYVWSASTLYKTYDINQVEIASGTAATLTTSADAFYIAFSGIASVDAFQLELGSTATTYEPYVSSDLFLQANAVGYKLPNGVADTIEYRNGKYYYVQMVKKYALVSDDIIGINTVTGSNNDWVYSKTILTDGFQNSSYELGHILVGGKIECAYSLPEAVNFDLVENRDKIAYAYTDGNRLYFIVTKGTYADLVAAQADLVGTVIYYQLATPIETEILSFGNLNGYQNATVYIDDVMQDADIYATNATITNTDYPIKTLEKIVKINSDGSQTNLAVSGATVASGGLSFTHSSLTSGDKVWFSYVYDVANLFKSTSIITFYDNKFVIADTANGKIYKWAVTSTNGVASIALTEV